MNSTHKFPVNSTVLCFEPDISKAKLIYFCKIIEHCSGQSKSKTEHLPEYFVHFFGWKRKFDRRVSEELILENNHFNRTLKRKIDEVAYNVKDTVERGTRINSILMGAATSSDKVDWNKIPGVWQPNEAEKDKIVTLPDQNLIFSFDSEADSSPEITSRIKCAFNNIDYMNFENDETHYIFMPRLSISKRLVEIIEGHVQHSRFINDTFTMAFLLQTYFDGFPYNQIKLGNWGQYNSYKDRIQLYNMMIIERNAKSMQQTYEERDRSRIIAAEVLHGLRVLFDELFYDYLLTKSELNFENSVTTPVFRMEDLAKFYSLYSVKTSIKLFPEEEMEDNLLRPFSSYGPRFFLRLLIRFPELMNRSSLSICKKALVMRHVQLFLNYLDETSLFWFASVSELSEKRIAFPLDSIAHQIAIHTMNKNEKLTSYFKCDVSSIETSSMNTLPQMTVESSINEYQMSEDLSMDTTITCGEERPESIPTTLNTEMLIDQSRKSLPLSSTCTVARKPPKRTSNRELDRLKMALVNVSPQGRRRIKRLSRADSKRNSIKKN